MVKTKGRVKLISSQEDKGCFIKEIKDNQAVRGQFLVKEVTLAETRAGKPFLTLALIDKTGELIGRVWDNAEVLQKECNAGGVISLTGSAQSYKGVLQLKVQDAKAVDSAKVDYSLFLQTASQEPKKMLADLKKIIATVEDSNLRQLLNVFFNDSHFMELFLKAPAAKNMHHAYVSGLLEHTLGVVKLADNISKLYPTIDRSLLICGAVLHDVGKVREFSFDNQPFDYSDQGRLVGHMVIAIGILQEKIAEIPSFPSELSDRLKHLILSHHGKYEFGSPVVPMIREAFVLNFIDDLDAKMNYLDRLSEQAEGEGYQWTPYQRTLERFLFVPGHSDDLTEENGELASDEDGTANKGGKQHYLWESGF